MASNQGLARLGFLADESQWGNQTRLSQDAQGRQVFLGHRGCPEELRLSQEDRYNTIATGWPRHDTCTAINNHVCRLNDPSDIYSHVTSRSHGHQHDDLDPAVPCCLLRWPTELGPKNSFNAVCSTAPATGDLQYPVLGHGSFFDGYFAGHVGMPELCDGGGSSHVKPGEVAAVATAQS